MKIDLHCHSHFSDGALSPAELLDKAIRAQIEILALTDHDTTAGLTPLRRAAENHSIKIIDGIEFSVCWKKHDIHIIGLNIDPNDDHLISLITQQNENRILRAQQISERLLDCGVEDAYLKACELAGHQRVGRPHFAQVLINEGRVSDMQSAFKRYLVRGRTAYIPTKWLDLEVAVEGIVQAGGQAVIAHPLKYKLTRSKLHELIKAFKIAGGVGMEVVSGAVTADQANEVAGLCCRFDLFASSGSDYHGDNLSNISFGQQRILPVNCVPIWNQWHL